MSTHNPDWPKQCMKGSPWVAKAQVMMAGDMSAMRTTLETYDNNHRVYSVMPHHLPQIQTSPPQEAPEEHHMKWKFCNSKHSNPPVEADKKEPCVL